MTEKEWLDIFSENLREIAEEYGYTQGDLAYSTNVTKSAMNCYFKGTRIPGIKALVNMYYELDIPMNEFIDFGSNID